MSEAEQNIGPHDNVRRLSDAIRDMKNAAADREDVVVDMREASRTRLELLAQELQPVFAEVPDDVPLFDFSISNGENPRLWIDAVAHVTMGRDRRTYRFLRDTRMGRVVLAESTHAGEVADKVTRYIAERMVERERMIEGDVEDLPRHLSDGETEEQMAARRLRARKSRRRGLLTGFLLVLLGAVTGAVVMGYVLSEQVPGLSLF
ncbi:hypothetical protein [Nitratireductor basaltis]|uniref:Uncharacterized protein n=1 Tax=Nitratireductor basaltis TaxID=472175 RepID=A0A084U916_9HYPH|nr:hypothetical protein [Nitratireductor basaltis]KFB09452.1 hypothetical protein EL18_00468 [Nitratireductor basaltis]